MKIEGLPVIDVDESEKTTVAVRADDLLEGDTAPRTGTPSPSPYVGKTTSRADIRLPDLREELANCSRRGQWHDGCMVRYVDLKPK
jgi:hypothetical protein